MYEGYEKFALIAALQLVYQQRFGVILDVYDNSDIQDKMIHECVICNFISNYETFKTTYRWYFHKRLSPRNSDSL